MFNQLQRLLAKGSPGAAPGGDSLDAFASEGSPSSVSQRPFPLRPVAGMALVIGAISVAVGLHALNSRGLFKAEAAGSLTVESDPIGATVVLDGNSKGVTPLVLSVDPGEHQLEVVLGERRKAMRTVVKAGAEVVHHVELGDENPSLAVPAATTGEVERGTPARAKTTTPAQPVGPAAGWLVISAPVPLHVVEKGEVLGTTAAERIMVQAGRRELQFVNEALGFSEKRVVQVTPGGTAKLGIQVPRASLNINAIPWAEVLVDGVRLGETPIGNHPVPIGEHEVVFRHPEFGERRQKVTVSLKGPARVSVDMRRSQ